MDALRAILNDVLGGWFPQVPWERVGPAGWLLVACSLALLAAGAWRLARGDATPSPGIRPPDPAEPRAPGARALGVLAFVLLFGYLVGSPPWLGDCVQGAFGWLGLDNQGSFSVQQQALGFGTQFAGQVLAILALLLLNSSTPGMLHTRPDATDAERLVLDRRGMVRLAGLFATCMTLIVLSTMAWSMFSQIAARQGQPLPGDVQPLVELIARWNGPGWVLGLLFASVTVGAPVIEELGFRSSLYPALRQSLPRGWAVALTGLLFGMVHGNLAGLLPISVMGAWLCLVRDRFGIGTCILLHALNNTWTVFWLITAPEVAGKL